jgi:hypothetical protein
MLLQQPQDHDLYKAADMEAVRRAVEADIGRDRARLRCGAQCVGVCALEHEASFGSFVEESVGRHGG